MAGKIETDSAQRVQRTRQIVYGKGSKTGIRREDTTPRKLDNNQEREALSCSHRDLERGTPTICGTKFR